MIRRLRESTLAVLTGGTGRAGEETLKALEGALERAVEIARPRGAYRFTTMTGLNAREALTHFGAIVSRKFSLMAGLASEPRQVVFTIATAGEAFDEELRREAPLLDKFVLDAVGSELVDILSQEVEAVWKQEAVSRGSLTTAMMSPGYCDWQIQGQEIVFKALDPAATGIRLTGSFLMVPLKSLSAAAVAAPELPLRVQCVTCDRSGCDHRRVPYDAYWEKAGP